MIEQWSPSGSTNQTVRPAMDSDLCQIVRIHQAAFQGFFLTQLGPAFLRAYYRSVLEYDLGILLIAEDQSKVVGFVAGFANPRCFYRELSSQKWRLAYPLLLGILRRPQNILRVPGRIRRVEEAGRGSGMLSAKTCELSSIGVHPMYAGKGLAKQLVSSFLQVAGGKGCYRVCLTTDATDNERANAFYHRMGFHLNRTFPSHAQRLLNEYVFTLESSEGG